MVKKNTIHITENELINFISETVISLTEQKYGTNSKGEKTYDGYTYGEHAKQWGQIQKYFGCPWDSFPTTINATRANPGSSGTPDAKWMYAAESYLRTILYSLDQRSGWSRNESMKTFGDCRYGIFGKRKGETLYDSLITKEYCKPRWGWHNVEKYVDKTYPQQGRKGGNWLFALHQEVGTIEMCKLRDLLMARVNYNWDNDGLKGLVNACKSSPWKCVEYTADAVAIIAAFFGPVGWVISTVAGFVSMYALYEQGEFGWALVVGALEIFGIFKIIKHIKTVKHLRGVGDDAIQEGIKYFDNPTTDAFARLSPDAQKVVQQMRTDKWIVKEIADGLGKSKTKDLILAVRGEKEFIKLWKSGTIKALDDIGYSEFQQLQKSLKYSDKVVNNVWKGVKTGAGVGTVLVGGGFVLNFLQNKINQAILSNNISDTEDYITGAKLDNTYHYRYDRVMGGRYPYNKKMVEAQYKEYLDDNILILNRIWFDKKTFPELRNNKTSQGDVLSATCVGVNVAGGSPNPGGGWRPNLDCLRDYSLSFNPEFDDTNILFEQILKDFGEGTITREEFNTNVERELNIPNVDKFELEFTEEEVWGG